MRNFQDGFILSEDEKIHHRNFCLNFSPNKTYNEFGLEVMVCDDDQSDEPVRFAILPYG